MLRLSGVPARLQPSLYSLRASYPASVAASGRWSRFQTASVPLAALTSRLWLPTKLNATVALLVRESRGLLVRLAAKYTEGTILCHRRQRGQLYEIEAAGQRETRGGSLLSEVPVSSSSMLATYSLAKAHFLPHQHSQQLFGSAGIRRAESCAEPLSLFTYIRVERRRGQLTYTPYLHKDPR